MGKRRQIRLGDRRDLSLSERTVNGYIESAKRKYEVTTRVQAVLFAARDGYINL